VLSSHPNQLIHHTDSTFSFLAFGFSPNVSDRTVLVHILCLYASVYIQSHDTQAQASGLATPSTARPSSPSYSYQSQRTVSDNFDTTAKAGPPSPGGKMDLLPFPHDTAPAGAKENNASGAASGSASSRHRSEFQILLRWRQCEGLNEQEIYADGMD